MPIEGKGARGLPPQAMNNVSIWETPFEGRPRNEPAVFFPILGTYSDSPARFHRASQSGNLINPVLLSVPELEGRYVHMLNLPGEYAGNAFAKAVRDRRGLVAVLAAHLAICMLLTLFWDAFRYPLMIMIAFLAVSLIYMTADYLTTFQSRDFLQERARYYAWLFVSCRVYLISISLFFLASGAVQFSSDDQFLEKFGLLYDLPEGEWWRALTGSLIHSGAVHWMTNFTIALVIAACCGPTQKYFFPLVFVLGGLLSFFLSLLYVDNFVTDPPYGLVGTSGGLAAVMACQLALCIRDRDWYPKRFYLAIGYFLLMTFIVGGIFVEKTSLVCHVFGVLVGLLMALVVPNYLKAPGGGKHHPAPGTPAASLTTDGN